MKVITIVYQDDQTDNGLGEGWVIPKFAKWCFPSSHPMGITHDILEHIMPNQKGHIHQELSAYGVILYGRYINNRMDDDVIARELLALYEDDCSDRANELGRTRIFKDFWEAAPELFADLQERTDPEGYTWMISWLADGWYRAKKLYQDRDGLSDLFHNLMHSIRRYVTGRADVGDKITIWYDPLDSSNIQINPKPRYQ